jgi:hypothetical protein
MKTLSNFANSPPVKTASTINNLAHTVPQQNPPQLGGMPQGRAQMVPRRMFNQQQ